MAPVSASVSMNLVIGRVAGVIAVSRGARVSQVWSPVDCRSKVRVVVARIHGSNAFVVTSRAMTPWSVSRADRSKRGKSRTGWLLAAASAVARAL
jgi:hypothetical protein